MNTCKMDAKLDTLNTLKQFFDDINSKDLFSSEKCNALALSGKCNDLEVSSICKTTCRAECLRNDQAFNTAGQTRNDYANRIGYCMLRYL